MTRRVGEAQQLGKEIELVTDGTALALLGDPSDVEKFLRENGLDTAPSRSLDMQRLRAIMGTSSAAARIGSSMAEGSGRWVKLSKESAQAMRTNGLMPTGKSGVSHAMIGQRGDIKQWLQVVSKKPVLVPGPFALAAVGTLMQQYAMQRQMDEIVSYLQTIDEKVDDIIRAQKDDIVADMISVDAVLRKALTMREQTGRVSEITWSKVQNTEQTINHTKAYALRQLEAIAGKLADNRDDLGKTAKATRDATPKIREWLAVLAHTWRLQEALHVLELDRVFDSAPEELEAHSAGLAVVRRQELEELSCSIRSFLDQMRETAELANSKVLFNPRNAPAVVHSSLQLAESLQSFSNQLELSGDSGNEQVVAKRWREAVGEHAEKAVERGAVVAGAAKRIGAQTAGRGAGVAGELSARLARRSESEDGTESEPRPT